MTSRAKQFLFRASVVALLMVTGCGSASAKGKVAAPRSGAEKITVPATPPVTYAFQSIDIMRPFTSEAMRGKPTVIVFMNIDDLNSQAQVNFLREMDKRDNGAVNYAFVAIEAPGRKQFVEWYRAGLQFTGFAAVADADEVKRSPFAPIVGVPTIVVLDAEGRIVLAHEGLVQGPELRARVLEQLTARR